MEIPCNPELYNCPLKEHFEDTHHKYFPRRFFRGIIEKTFRDLPDNKVIECRYWHQLEHEVVEPPEKPPKEEMALAVEEGVVKGEVYLSVRLSKALDDIIVD